MDAALPGCINIRSGVAIEVDLCASFEITNGVELLWEALLQVLDIGDCDVVCRLSNSVYRDDLQFVERSPTKYCRTIHIYCIESVCGPIVSLVTACDIYKTSAWYGCSIVGG